MASTGSNHVSPPPSPPPMDNRSNQPPPTCTEVSFPKSCGNENMWCEWCKQDQCNNVEYDKEVIQDECYATFLGEIDTEYLSNLTRLTPVDNYEYSPERYIKRIRFWHYKNYAEQFGFAWGGGHDSELPLCLTSKIRMTFRQPATDFDQWVKEPRIYMFPRSAQTITDDTNVLDNIILGKRKERNI